jgi:hypothetical protein
MARRTPSPSLRQRTALERARVWFRGAADRPRSPDLRRVWNDPRDRDVEAMWAVGDEAERLWRANGGPMIFGQTLVIDHTRQQQQVLHAAPGKGNGRGKGRGEGKGKGKGRAQAKAKAAAHHHHHHRHHHRQRGGTGEA